MIATGKIGATDRAVEQDIADMGEAHILVEKDHAAGGMAGAMQDIEGQFADRNLLAFFEPAIRHEIAHIGETEARPARHHIVEQKFIGDMRTFDRDLECVA